MNHITYGPVPSRRLGQSLGINNIPPKTCSYSCLYCQLGNTTNMLVERAAYYQAEAIAQNVKDRVQQVRKKGELIDYLTFVPDGEPTLDANLGTEIELLRPLGIKIAVITNASLIWRKDVRRDLQQADLVSLKIDTVSEEIWRRVNRPHRSLRLEAVLAGMLQFGDDFSGELTTETMLIEGVNDGSEQIERTSDFLAQLKPDKAYLAVPTRPPTEKSTKAASEQAISMAHQVFSERLGSVEYLIGYEGNAFAFTGNVTEDLLSITSVHPMREEAVAQFLSKAGAGWEVIEKLILEGTLVELTYQGQKFYMRTLPGRQKQGRGIAMRCSRCNQEMPEEQTYVHQGELLCEDCYLEAVRQVKACDPWAVHAATRAREILGLKGTEGLSELQKAIYEFIKDRGKVTWEELMENFRLPQHEMETQFAILRHCELVRGHKEKGTIYATTFEYGQGRG